MRWKRSGLTVLVPIRAGQVRADRLFIHAVDFNVECVILFGPEARCIRGENLVDKDELPIDQAEFQLTVR
ncbi:hypothetical protein D3C72_1959530 [compost metagenome]